MKHTTHGYWTQWDESRGPEWDLKGTQLGTSFIIPEKPDFLNAMPSDFLKSIWMF